MMSNNNHHNLQCGFAEDLVSYLYDEINSADKSKFEKHLDKCSTCDKELAAFGFVRSSITDWREENFSMLETPKIEIPYSEKQKTFEIVGISNESRSLTARLRDLFTLSPTWATAFAALLVLTVLTIVVINFSKPVDVSNIIDENPPKETLAINDTNTQLTEQNPVTDDKPIFEKDQPKPDLVKENKPETISEPNEKKIPLPKKIAESVSDKSPKPKKLVRETRKPNETITANRNENSNKPEVRVTRDAPKLTNFADDEDDSLRLADLFDEVGSR